MRNRKVWLIISVLSDIASGFYLNWLTPKFTWWLIISGSLFFGWLVYMTIQDIITGREDRERYEREHGKEDD
jgi:hypothetical protein